MTELLKSLPQKPDVVHCNDWQSALVPIYIRDEAVRDDFYKGIRTVITVHNIEYQAATAAARSKTCSAWTMAGSTAARSNSAVM